ncbi:MAG: SIS domain-containing protein [Oscillospiraceae bacterium]|nr:SIS domain-containing protein [Oscillospiraceae bacterium]
MSIASEYRDGVVNLVTAIADTQEENIKRGAKLCADAVKNGRLINVIGPGGHSNIAVEEVLWRAGGLVHINAILDPGTNVIHGAKRSNIIERTPGYARAVFDSYRLSEGDVLIIVNAYGINSMTVDSALLCRERGIKSIGITSTSFAHTVPKDAPSRHPSGQNLPDLVDVYIDNHLPLGDAIIKLPGMEQKMGSTSTYANCFSINLLMMQTAQELLDQGITPAVWQSANMPDGDSLNKRYEDELLPKIRHL